MIARRNNICMDFYQHIALTHCINNEQKNNIQKIIIDTNIVLNDRTFDYEDSYHELDNVITSISVSDIIDWYKGIGFDNIDLFGGTDPSITHLEGETFRITYTPHPSYDEDDILLHNPHIVVPDFECNCEIEENNRTYYVSGYILNVDYLYFDGTLKKNVKQKFKLMYPPYTQSTVSSSITDSESCSIYSDTGVSRRSMPIP